MKRLNKEGLSAGNNCYPKSVASVYWSTECSNFFGVAKRTLYRLILEGKNPSVNLGTYLLGIDRKIIAEMFAIFHSLPESENTLKKKLYKLEKEDCYSISEIAERFQIYEGSVYSHIRKYSILTRQSGKYVYTPKMEITNLYNGNDFI